LQRIRGMKINNLFRQNRRVATLQGLIHGIERTSKVSAYKLLALKA
jgi:hypothetical protein